MLWHCFGMTQKPLPQTQVEKRLKYITSVGQTHKRKQRNTMCLCVCAKIHTYTHTHTCTLQATVYRYTVVFTHTTPSLALHTNTNKNTHPHTHIHTLKHYKRRIFVVFTHTINKHNTHNYTIIGWTTPENPSLALHTNTTKTHTPTHTYTHINTTSDVYIVVFTHTKLNPCKGRVTKKHWYIHPPIRQHK